jgi:hypothetical protein
MQYKYKTSKGEKSLNYHATRDADSMGEERKGRGAKISHCTVLHVTVTGIRGPLLDIVLQSAVQEERTDMQPVRLAGGWWLVLICSERKVLLAGC